MSNYTKWTLERMFLTYIIITGLLIGVLFMGAILVGNQTKHSSYKEIRVEELANINAQYRGINETYFANTLPQNTVVTLEPDADGRNDVMGTASCDDYKNCVINIVPRWNPSGGEKVLTLEHEMCHVELDSNSDPEVQADNMTHGPMWKACMRRLARDGAMEPYW